MMPLTVSSCFVLVCDIRTGVRDSRTECSSVSSCNNSSAADHAMMLCAVCSLSCEECSPEACTEKAPSKARPLCYKGLDVAEVLFTSLV